MSKKRCNRIVLAVLIVFCIVALIIPASALPYDTKTVPFNSTVLIDATNVSHFGVAPDDTTYVRVFFSAYVEDPTKLVIPDVGNFTTANSYQITVATENHYHLTWNYKTFYFAPHNSTGWDTRYGTFFSQSSSAGIVPNVNFTASPTYGFLPLQVQFTDTSNQTNSQWSWNYGDGQSSNGSVSNPIHTYTLPGVYTVRMDAYSATYGWYNLTRTNYITATNPSGVVFNVDIKDSISGALIQDSSVGIRNTSSGVWRNGTAPTGLIYYDTTDPGYLYPLSVNQSVTIAASKTGYKDTSSTFSIPYDNYRAFLYLVPSSVVNATGTGTVIATVVRNKDGLPLSGTSVTLDTGQMGITNSAGAVTLRNVTAGTPTATVINSGYQTTSSTFTLSAGETKMVVIQMVLDGESPVTTYGSPTPTRTPGPGDPGYAGVNTSSGALNERGSTGLMEMMGQLIELWPLVLIILFMKFMKDAFS